jgi:ferrochelatase
VGVLLVNLGTPASPSVREVRRYLRELLSDPHVLDLPRLGRWALLNLFILPFRPRTSAAIYAKVWTPRGSPLLVNCQALREGLAERLGAGFRVDLGMRYGLPTIRAALGRFAEADVRRIILVPLFPQYASSSTGSAVDHVEDIVAASPQPPQIQAIDPFYQDPGFISALTAVTTSALASFHPDHILMSYHGIPERHVRKTDPTGHHCLSRSSCCDSVGDANRYCYRAHCFATSRALAAALGLPPERYSVAFQSRLGRIPWIQPYTDLVLPELAARGIRRLAVVCPSFLADCLETLEEIGMRARDQWQALGGEAFLLVPCLNAHPRWVEALATIVQDQSSRVST